MYESPMDVIYGDLQTKVTKDFEDRIMYEVHRQIGVDVDKDELISALMYDRQQYEKGYHDAKEEYKHSLTFNEIKEIVLGIESQEPEIQFIKGLILGSVAKKISEKNSLDQGIGF